MFKREECAIESEPVNHERRIADELLSRSGYDYLIFTDSFLGIKKAAMDILKARLHTIDQERKALDNQRDQTMKALDAILTVNP